MNFKYILAVIFSFFVVSAYAFQSDLLSLNKNDALAQNSVDSKAEKKINIKITPSISVKQGQTIFMNIQSSKNLDDPKFSVDGKEFALYKVSNNLYRGILGVDALEKTGSHKIKFFDSTGMLNNTASINVASGKFPIQNIVISKGKAGLAPAPGELAKVQSAKNMISSVAYWTNPPFNSPTKGPIVSIYGVTRYHNGKPTGDFHKGVDIKAPAGQEINTISGGKVTIARQFRLHGGTVAVDHGQGLTSIYIHMSKIYVKEGQILKTGQPIGAVGSTGFATGPHLHWGLYVNGVSVDPMKFWIKST